MSGQESLLAYGTGAYHAAERLPERKGKAPTATERMLAALLGQDAQKEVAAAARQWNLSMRDAIRGATALRLLDERERRADRPRSREGEKERVAVPVHVVDGMPDPFARAMTEFDPAIWWLAMNRPLFEGTRDGLWTLVNNSERLERLCPWGPDKVEPATSVLRGSAVLIDSLLQTEKVASLDKRLKEIDVDVLGAYWFRVPRIELYWMVIGAYARFLNVAVGDLTVVVLCHELAHAYTHLGRDIDGRTWDTDAFARSDKHIVEGMAQYYTQAVLTDLAPRLPGALAAFRTLLERQPAPYTCFTEWFDAGDARTGEAVRSAMIQYRRERERPYDAFCKMLRTERDRIRGLAA